MMRESWTWKKTSHDGIFFYKRRTHQCCCFRCCSIANEQENLKSRLSRATSLKNGIRFKISKEDDQTKNRKSSNIYIYGERKKKKISLTFSYIHHHNNIIQTCLLLNFFSNFFFKLLFQKLHLTQKELIYYYEILNRREKVYMSFEWGKKISMPMWRLLTFQRHNHLMWEWLWTKV